MQSSRASSGDFSVRWADSRCGEYRVWPRCWAAQNETAVYHERPVPLVSSAWQIAQHRRIPTSLRASARASRSKAS
jgi:hypothetical protein